MPDITPDVLSNAIMGKLYDVLTNGDATVPKSADNFFSWETPGVPVTTEDFRFLTQGLTGVVRPEAAKNLLQATNPTPPAGAPATATTSDPGAAPTPPGLTDAQLAQLRAEDLKVVLQQAESFARLVDFIPDVASMNGRLAQLAVQTDNGTLSDVYKLTLDMCQVMQSVVADDEKARIADLRARLTTTTKTTDLVTGAEVDVVSPSPLTLAYLSKMTAYDNAALAYNNARINAMAGGDPQAVAYFEVNAPILRNLVNAAMSDWETAGYKSEYEEIAAFIALVEGRDVSLMVAGYKDDLEKAKLTGVSSGGDFYYTALTPADFYESTGWSQFHFSSGDISHYANSSFASTGWSVKASAGFFGIGASGGASHDQSHQSYRAGFDATHCSMAFEICQVAIARDAWMKASFLNSKTWRFDPGNPDVRNNLLSDGGSPPKGLLPAYPTSIIFIRNLVLDFGDNSGVQSFMEQQRSDTQSGGVSFSLGPFSLGTRASHQSASGSQVSQSNYSWSDQGLSVPGMQIVGYRCHLLPKAPDPSPTVTTWI